MLRQQRGKQQQMEIVILEQLVPQDHFLRKVKTQRISAFINKLCAPLYCADNGRPAIEPEVLFRMLLRSELSVWHKVGEETGRRDKLQYRIQVVLRAGTDGESSGCDDDQPEPTAQVP